MRTILFKFASDNSGATVIEYALIASIVSIVILTAVTGIGTTLNTTFTNVNSALSSN